MNSDFHVDTGTLDISSTADECDLFVVWAEDGGPTIDAPPDVLGFGSTLLSRSMSGSLGGVISYDWQPSGLVATIQLKSPETDLAISFKDFYRDAPFVRFVEDSPRVAAVLGSNMAELAIHQDGESAAILVALDNLMKGMAGQGIQNLNLALGLEERTGLWQPGRCP